MTLLQLTLADAISRNGSISTAAKEMGISQPNASKYLRQLENELGFVIFARDGRSFSTTDKGNDFLYHARKIIAENKKIHDINEAEHFYKLRAGGMNYSVPIFAFKRLCEEQKNNRFSELQFLNASAETGLKLLFDNKLDIFVLAIIEQNANKYDRVCKRLNLTKIDICKIQGVVNVRKGHPLENEIGNKPITLEMFKDYPYVDYRSIESTLGLFNIDEQNYVSYTGKISVDERDTRLSLISSTDAFGLGVALRKEIMEKYNLISFDIPGALLDICCVVRSGEQSTMEIKRYLEIFREEMEVE